MSNPYEIFCKAFDEQMKKEQIRIRKNHKHKMWSRNTYWIRVVERTCGECGYLERKENRVGGKKQ